MGCRSLFRQFSPSLVEGREIFPGKKDGAFSGDLKGGGGAADRALWHNNGREAGGGCWFVEDE